MVTHPIFNLSIIWKIRESVNFHHFWGHYSSMNRRTFSIMFIGMLDDIYIAWEVLSIKRLVIKLRNSEVVNIIQNLTEI